MVHAVVIAVFAAIVLLAGAGVARRVFRGVIDDESRLLLAAACGGTVVAFALVILWRAHAMTHGGVVLSAVLAACIALNGRDGLRELRDAARASWRPWTFFGLAAVAATAAFHGRQIRFDDDGGFSWGGTLGVESMFHAAVSGALLRGETVWPEPTFQAFGRIQYHVFSHLLAGAASRWSGIGVIEIYARSLPVVLFTFAFAAHRWLLRTWFPASWTLSAAALLPLLVTDFTPWARFFGLDTHVHYAVPYGISGVDLTDLFEHRTGHSFVVSPSFVAGQAFACIALGLAVRLGHIGAAAPRAAVIGTGVLLGSIVGWKLPAAVIAAVSVGAVLPWLRSMCGTRAVGVAVVAAGLSAAVAQRLCFGKSLGHPGIRLQDPGHWLDAASSRPELLACAALWPILVLGARCLRPRSILAMVKLDASVGAVLAAACAGVVGVVVLRIPPMDEEKYLLRCGAYTLLLVVGALIFRDIASPGRRRWWGIASAGVLAMSCAWQFRQIATGAASEGALSRAEIEAIAAGGGLVGTSGRADRRLDADFDRGTPLGLSSALSAAGTSGRDLGTLTIVVPRAHVEISTTAGSEATSPFDVWTGDGSGEVVVTRRIEAVLIGPNFVIYRDPPEVRNATRR